MRRLLSLCAACLAGACLGVEFNKVDEPPPGETCGAYLGACDDALLEDPDNCCIEGRSCLEGTCQDGRCQPVQLSETPDTGDGFDLVVDEDETVYWTGGYSRNIYRIAADAALDGQPAVPQSLLITAENYAAGALVIDDGTIYFTLTDGFEIRSVPVSGAPESTLVAFTPDHINSEGRLVTAGDYIYWAASVGCPTPRADNQECFDPGAPPGALFRIRKDAGSPDAEMLRTAEFPVAIAVDGDDLYWSEHGAMAGVYRMSLSGGEPTQIAPLESYINDVAVYGDRLYWTDGTRLKTVPLDGGSIQTLTANAMDMSGDGAKMAFDDSHVYWTIVTGEVFRTSLDGIGEVVRVGGTNGGAATGIGIGCDVVVYLENSSQTNPGRVYRVAK